VHGAWKGLNPDTIHSFIHIPNKNLQVLFANLFGLDIIYSASILENPQGNIREISSGTVNCDILQKGLAGSQEMYKLHIYQLTLLAS
jgi:hypothetical protein